jgi:hypothetical protein
MTLRPINGSLTSDKIYYVNFLEKCENKGAGTTALSFSGILVEQFPHRRHHVNVLVGHPAQTLGQEFGLLAKRFVLVHDKNVLPLDDAETALDLDAGNPQVLFRHFHLKFLSQLFKFRIKSFWSHNKFFCEKFMKVLVKPWINTVEI